MNLVRWFRKNNTKVMAVVVIVIMVGFVGGSALMRLLQPRQSRTSEVLAHYLDESTVTLNDVIQAQQELDILGLLGTGQLLQNLADPMLRSPDIRSMILGELLFTETTTSTASYQILKQAIQSGNYQITDKQLNDMYSQRTNVSRIYWLMLTREAELAGVSVSNEQAAMYLANNVVPWMSGAVGEELSYKQVVGSIVNRHGIPESSVLSAFGKLLAVLDYARIINSGEDITIQQVRHVLAQSRETVDVEFVQFDTSVFVDEQPEPSEQEVVDHFEKYKSIAAGQFSSDNPYGFGYKIPDRVRLEYVAVMLADIETIIEQPTEEDAEEYYQRNKANFTRKVPLDPNDPNSPMTDTQRSYAEVANAISTMLVGSRKTEKAEQILRELKNQTTTDMSGVDVAEAGNLTADELKQRSGDYAEVARQLSEKYSIDVYSGQTGLISAGDMESDMDIRAMYMGTPPRAFTGMIKTVMSADDLGGSEPGPMDMAKPRLYENLGPFRDFTQRTLMVVRVIETAKAASPQSIETSYEIKTVNLDIIEDANSEDEKVYSVRGKVVEDLKMLGAMDQAKTTAEQFKTEAGQGDWQESLDKFNRIYGKDSSEDNASEEGPALPSISGEPFELQNMPGMRRMSDTDLETMVLQSQGDPTRMLSVERTRRQKLFLDSIYELVAPDSNSLTTLPAILEFKPEMSFYCLKSVIINRMDQSDYNLFKVLQAYRDDYVQAQSLSIIHFNPEQILKRMKFEFVPQAEVPGDPNEPNKGEET